MPSKNHKVAYYNCEKGMGIQRFYGVFLAIFEHVLQKVMMISFIKTEENTDSKSTMKNPVTSSSNVLLNVEW